MGLFHNLFHICSIDCSIGCSSVACWAAARCVGIKARQWKTWAPVHCGGVWQAFNSRWTNPALKLHATLHATLMLRPMKRSCYASWNATPLHGALKSKFRKTHPIQNSSRPARGGQQHPSPFVSIRRPWGPLEETFSWFWCLFPQFLFWSFRLFGSMGRNSSYPHDWWSE